MLHVSGRTVFTLVKTGRLRAVRFGPVKRRKVRRNGREIEVEHGGTVRIDRRDLDAFIQQAKGGRGGSSRLITTLWNACMSRPTLWKFG